MAAQDFQINIRTLADLTGIKITQQQLDALKDAASRGNIAAIEALKKLAAAQKEAVASQKELSAGFTGTAIGVGTIITALTTAINKWEEFQDELDRAAEKMIQAQEKMRTLGESILDTQDAAISLRRIASEPLEESFNRLNQEIIRLKTEQSSLDLPRQGEEWKKLNAEIKTNEGLLDKVTSAMEKEKDQADKLAEAKEKAAYAGASPQAKAIIENEKRAREAKAKGDENSAAQFQKTADQLRASASAADLAGVQAVSDAQGKAPRPGRAAGAGESQELVDQMERNRIAAEKQSVEEGTGGPSLIGDEARKAREAGEKTLSMQEEVEFQKRQGLMRTAHAAKEAAADREAANAGLRGENRAGEIERQTQDAKREREGEGKGREKTDAKLSSSIDALVRELSKWS